MTEQLILVGLIVTLTLVLFAVGLLALALRPRPFDAEGSRRRLSLGPLAPVFVNLPPTLRSRKESLRAELLHAGYFHRRAAEQFLSLRNMALIAWLCFCGCVYGILLHYDRQLEPVMIAVAAVVAILIFALPRIILSTQATERLQKIQYALPDALDLINMMITGGLPVRQSIERVSEELQTIHPALADELSIVHQQATAGSLDTALRQFAKRIDVPDIVGLATMVRHADQLGGNVAEAFREQADSMRHTRKQRAEELGNRASVKMLFPILLFLAPPIYILLLGPAALELRSFLKREVEPGGALSQTISQTGAQITPEEVRRSVESGEFSN